MRNEKWVWLDMDGTIADFYSVENWLDYLMAFDTTPYAQAKPMYNEIDILETLLNLKAIGYKIGVISWGSKANNDEYDNRVRVAKNEWLKKYNFDLVLDKVIVTPYGVRKADTCRKFGYGILVDDEEQNRNAWDIGETINATENIIKALARLM